MDEYQYALNACVFCIGGFLHMAITIVVTRIIWNDDNQDDER